MSSRNTFHFKGVKEKRKEKRIETREQRHKRIQGQFIKDYAKWIGIKKAAEDPHALILPGGIPKGFRDNDRNSLPTNTGPKKWKDA